jgi:hypothetical protein
MKNRFRSRQPFLSPGAASAADHRLWPADPDPGLLLGRLARAVDPPPVGQRGILGVLHLRPAGLRLDLCGHHAAAGLQRTRLAYLHIAAAVCHLPGYVVHVKRHLAGAGARRWLGDAAVCHLSNFHSTADFCGLFSALDHLPAVLHFIWLA